LNIPVPLRPVFTLPSSDGSNTRQASAADASRSTIGLPVRLPTSSSQERRIVTGFDGRVPVSTKKAQSFDHENDVSLHVENAAAKKSVVFNASRIFDCRADRVDSVRMAKQESSLSIGLKSPDDQMIATLVSLLPLDGEIERKVAKHLDDSVDDLPALLNIVRRRFDVNDLADRCDHRFLPGSEVGEYLAWAHSGPKA
jgi:ribosomal protein L23